MKGREFKNAGIVGVLFAALMAAMPVQAAEYKIDPTHSFVEFRIQHLGFSWLYGRFNDIKGDFSYDEKKPASSRFDVEIATESVDTNHAERDKHLKSKDFLEVDKFPKAAFKTTSFKGERLEGVLTLHGVSRPISIKVEKVGEGKDPWGGYRAGFYGTTAIKKSDFGISYNLGPAGETIEFELGIEGIRK